MQTDLWGQRRLRSEHIFVFHDESVPNKKWFLIGLLFVPERYLSEVEMHLNVLRKEGTEVYSGEIHFAELPRTFDNKYTAKARVARRWIDAYPALSDKARFSALAVYRGSPAFEHHRFRKEYHSYNRFTAMAVWAGVNWLFKNEEYDLVELTVVSDAKPRMSRPEQGFVDNFEKYLVYRIARDARERGNFEVRIREVRLQDSKRSNFLQLVDLLLGGLQQALTQTSTKETKQYIGKKIAQWFWEVKKPRREQTLDLFRRFDVWGFPDRKGKPFHNLPIPQVEPKQLRLL